MNHPTADLLARHRGAVTFKVDEVAIEAHPELELLGGLGVFEEVVPQGHSKQKGTPDLEKRRAVARSGLGFRPSLRPMMNHGEGGCAGRGR